MICAIAKWYISRAIDCNRELPGWVERRMDRDPSLRQFYDQSQRLAARLRSAESGDVSRGVSVNDVVSQRGELTHSNLAAVRFAALAIGLAAVALFAFAPFFYRFTSGSRSLDAGLRNAQSGSGAGAETSAKSVEPPVDRNQIDSERLRDLIASGRSLMDRLKQVKEPLSETASDSSLEQLVALADLEVGQVLQPVSDLGAGYGELLSNFDRLAEIENRKLISDGVGAWNFVVRKLPQSAASLAGL